MAGVLGDRAAPSPHQLPARQSAPNPSGRAGLSARRQLMPADISTPGEREFVFPKARDMTPPSRRVSAGRGENRGSEPSSR